MQVQIANPVYDVVFKYLMEGCTKDPHIMEVIEDEFPEIYRCIVRRLKMAASDPEVRKQMKLEDRIVKYLRKWVRESVRIEKEKNKINEQKIAELSQSLEEERKKNETFAARLAELERLMKP